MLDNTPQKDRAALSQSKGLKDRRLPANLATKVPDDYQARRRAKSYSTGDLKKKERLARSYDATDSGLKQESEEMSEEERKKKILERSGISQSSPLAALGNILKRRGSGRSKKSPLASPVPKPKKEKPAKDSPSMARHMSELTASTPLTPPKSPKGFLRRWGSKGSGRKKGKLGGDFGSLDGSVDDIRSETSSISSFQTAGRDVPMETERLKSISPEETPVKLIKENGGIDTSPEPLKEKSLAPLAVANTSSASVRSSKHDSACFHEVDVEPLFGDTSTLFDSGELESMFGKGSKSAGRKSRERTPEKILEQPAAEKEEKKAEQPKEERKTKLEDDVDKVSRSTQKPSRKLAEKSAPETLAEKLAVAKSTEKSSKADIRSRLHMYESSYKSSTDASEETVLTSTPKHETTAAKKTTLLFEDEGSEMFASKSKEKEEQKTDVEKKKARLFDDELFQDDLKSEPPKKIAAKKELFSSPVRKSREASESSKRQQKSSLEGENKETREASESPKRQQKSSVEGEDKETSDLFSSAVKKSREASESPKRQQKSSVEENKETSEIGPGISLVDEVLMATSKSSVGEPVEEPSTEEEKSKAEGDNKKKYRYGLYGLLEDDESPRLAAKKVSESKKVSEDKEKHLDAIADSIFGETKATEEKQKEKEKKLDEIADSLFGDDPRHKARARRRAKKLSTDPVVRTDMSEAMSDPLGALEEKTAVEKESEERQKKLSTKERKAKTTDLFGEEIVEDDAPWKAKKTDLFGEEVDAPSDIGSKVSSSSEQSQVKPAVSPEITVQESTPPPGVTASAEEKAQVETAPEEKDKEETDKDTEKNESKVDVKDTRSPSPRIGRNRDSTAEMVKTAAEKKAKTPSKEEKKDEEGGKPSWMVELQKRRDHKKSEGEEKKVRVKATSASKDKELKEAVVPEWQKRAIERRKKAAEASKSSPSSSRLGRDRPEKTSASSKLDTSPRTGRRVTSETATAASPKSGRRSPRETDRTTTASPRTGRRSPRDTTDTASLKTGRRNADTSPTSLRTGRRSPRDKEESRDSAGTKSPVRFRSKYREELEREKAEKEKAEKEKAAKADKPTLPKKPADITVDSKSSKVTRKPSMEKKSSKIEITTRKVARSSEREQKEEQKKPSFTDNVQSPKREPTKSEEPKSKLSDEETKQRSEMSSEEIKTDKKSQSEPEEDTDDVFSSEKVESSCVGESKREDKRSPSPKVLTKATSVDSGNSSRRSSVSSETTEQAPYRSRNISHSRSPTPTPGQPPPGPMKLLPSDSSVPEWKKKLMERKKSGEVVKKTEPVVARRGEKEVPAWKKQLMARRRSKSPEFTSSLQSTVREVRSSTVSTTRPSLQSRAIGSAGSSGRSGRADKKKKEEPAFMKEFQLKKQRSTARET